MIRQAALRATFALILCGFAVVPAQAQGAQHAPQVVELRFPGAETFTRADLAAAIATGESRCPSLLLRPLCWVGVAVSEARLEPGALEADALRLRVYYYERGFRHAAVVPSADTAGDRVRVAFRIDEGRPVRVSRIDLQGMPAAVRAGPLPLEVGQPFDVVAYEAGRDTLLARLRNGGHARAQVLLGYSISQDDPYSALVQYDVLPGAPARFGPIEVVGTAETSPELVYRMLSFEQGEPYDRSALLESQRNLYGLQIFRHAEVQADLEAEPDSVIPVTVQVAEGNLRRVRLGGGLDNVECANVEARWTSRNFAGGGRRLELRGRIGNLLIEEVCQRLPGLSGMEQFYDSITGLVAVDFTQPWFFSPRNNIGVGVFVERSSVPDVFVRSAVGGYLSVGRRLGRGAALSVAYRPELTGLRTEGDLFFCVNFIACAYEDIGVLRDPHWLSPMTLSFTWDRSDAVFSPASGFILRADLEHAAHYTGSDFAFTRLLGEGSTYGGEPGGVVVAARVRGGIGWPDESDGMGALNPQKRFFGGGPNSVRGFGQYRLGPTVLGVDAVEWLADVDDPETAEVEGAGCTVTSINDRSCDPGPLAARPGAFDARPAGGEVLLEGNVEVRFPLPVGGGKLRGAAFLDAGQVWSTTQLVELGDLAATPGVGVRYYSPVGPIRVDAGFNLQGPRSLAVLTTRVEECLATEDGCQRVPRARATLRNTDDLVVLAHDLAYEPYASADTWKGFLQRFQLHFSIGQAF